MRSPTEYGGHGAEPGGYPLEYITGRLRENLLDKPIPLALIACEGTNFVGTASIILSDMAERPQYSPWVAAVWTEPAFRELGVGAALVDRAAQTAFDPWFWTGVFVRVPGSPRFLRKARLDTN